MFVIKYRKIFYAVTIALVAVSVFSMVYFGFNIGIDFKGGSILEVSYTDQNGETARPAMNILEERIDKLNLGNYSIRPTGENNYLIRTRQITENERGVLLEALYVGNGMVGKEERFNSVGPIVGQELQKKANVAIAIVIIAIVLFITFAFRKVSEPVSSWKYGVTTIVALVHDVVVSAGLFVLFTHFAGGEIDILFVSAILAVLGYSVHDTIVVFDRVRENLRLSHEHHDKKDFETIVGESVRQTFGRSINTSVTIFLVLLAVFFIGSPSTKDFSLVLLIGIVAGTYSSIFLASPLLVTLEKLQRRGKQNG